MATTKTILVVDDEPDAIAIAETALEEIGGITVLSAPDGASGIKKAKEVHPDLIVLDVQMPGMDGFEVFAALRKDPSLKHTPVVMLTGVAQKSGIGFSAKDMGEFLGEKPNAYLEKPFEPSELQDTVKGILGP